MHPGHCKRFPVSSYAAYLFAAECGEIGDWLRVDELECKSIHRDLMLPIVSTLRGEAIWRSRRCGGAASSESPSVQFEETLQKPVEWNQGGYDAVKMRVFFLRTAVQAKISWNEESELGSFFCVVKPAQWIRFEFGDIEDHGLLEKFDGGWTHPENQHVKVRAFEVAPVL
ncbi:hypothetical protein GQ600_20484 [Phytophthora cactorum]|nr:hypothetical protein GQ600_20484 [Phytophthora cactorum]